jgi:hypothetical protein
MRVSKNKRQMPGTCKHVTVSITQSFCLKVLCHSTAFLWVANAVGFQKVYFYDSNTANGVYVFAIGYKTYNILQSQTTACFIILNAC